MGNGIDAQAGDVSSRSAHLPVMTSDTNADTGLGSRFLEELADEDVPQEEDGDVNVHIGEDSYIGDEQNERVGGARTRAIDLWD